MKTYVLEGWFTGDNAECPFFDEPIPYCYPNRIPVRATGLKKAIATAAEGSQSFGGDKLEKVTRVEHWVYDVDGTGKRHIKQAWDYPGFRHDFET